MGEAWKKRGYRTTCPAYESGLVLPPVGLKQNSLRIPIFECRGRSDLGSADMSALLESWSWFLQLLLSENWPFIATTFLWIRKGLTRSREPFDRAGVVSCLVEGLGSVLGFPVFIFFSSLLVTVEAKGDEWNNERPKIPKQISGLRPRTVGFDTL